MLDYDREAERYDETRGGQIRADAAADALEVLLGSEARSIVDVGAGTGIVSAAVAARGRQVIAVDASFGMLGRAAARLGGRCLCADAARLPLREGGFDGVYAMWLLHLVPDPEAVVAECLRVLRPGGIFVTSVDLHVAHRSVPCDVNEVLGRYAAAGWVADESDGRQRVLDAATVGGARYLGQTTYLGHGRGQAPGPVADALGHGYEPVGPLTERARAACARELRALPDPTVRRPDPVYTLLAVAAG